MHAVNYRPIPGKGVTTGEVFMAASQAAGFNIFDCLEVLHTVKSPDSETVIF